MPAAIPLAFFLTTLKAQYLTFFDWKDFYMLKKSILAVVSVVVVASLLSACNTTRGVGEDISAGGNAIQKSASQ
jgi:entericidin B